MASPFRYFRKHTKVFLAVAAVLAIFIFVVGDAIGRGGGGGGAGDYGQVVATWNGGKLTAGQLGSLIAQRKLTDDFLKAVFVQGGGSTGYDFPANIPQLFLNQQQLEQLDTEVIGMEVISDLAEQAGMTVSDSLINHYIQEIGLKKVDGETVGQILNNIGQGNQRANESIVFNTLRKMLMAHFYRRTFADASMVVLPQERWNDWRKVNERISVEAAALPVEKFIDQVPEPTEDQLRAFYADYKEFEPGRFQQQRGRELPLPEPGFAESRRVRLQYLMASVAGRAEKLMDGVTEEEIKDYYERNKRTEFTKLDLPENNAFDAPASEPGRPGPSAPPTSSAESPTEPATEPASPPTEAAPQAEEPATPPADDSPAADDATESNSNARRPSPFRLVAFQEEPATTDEPAESTEQPAAPTEEPADNAAPRAETEEPAVDTPAEAPADADARAAEAAAATIPAAIDPAASLPADEAIEYEPLEKVREDIRKRLATDKAVEELERIMSEAAAQLQAEYNQYGSQVAAAQENEKPAPKPPEKLTDLKWLADQYGLTYEKTTPLTVRELFDTAVGKAGDAASQQVSVTQAAFQSLELYEPMLAQELEGDYYLVMKIEDTPRKVPEFKDVRDQVEQAWKRAEAAKLAEAKAKELAAEVTKSGAPFDQFFFAERGFEAIKPTAFFSWRSYPVGRAGTGTPPTLSDIPELKNVGEEFMRTAFNLEGKDAAAVMNSDRSIAYVVRLDRKQYTDEELRQLFLEEEGSWGGRIDMLNEHYYSFNNAVEREILEVRAGLEFNEEWLAERNQRLQERQN